MKTQPSHIFILVLLALLSAHCKKEISYEFSEIQEKHVTDFDAGYEAYCHLDLTTDFKLNAVQCSFYGDYHNALDQATKGENPAGNAIMSTPHQKTDTADLIKTLEMTLRNPQVDESEKSYVRKMLNLLTAPTTDELFNQARPANAIDFITEKAKDFHYTLINEAHFNSQHRAFTRALLKPMWDKGYRYLALETLNHNDKDIHQRGYPVNSSGYYTKDSHFGYLVREALQIGYRLISYETQNDHDGTLRDRDQAHNIYEKTWKQDNTEKVLIHAGYSHIYEMGSRSFEPMGFQLKNLINHDILTIDQENMVGFKDSAKQHQYYREAVNQFDLNEATVFLSDSDKVLVDPVNSLGIDIQVYHPETKFIHRRPHWMIRKGLNEIPLPTELTEYREHLIQAVPKGEATDAVPVDQFVISEEKVFILDTGNYDLRLINCQGDLVATLELEVF
mgnify:CR=1 FL=1